MRMLVAQTGCWQPDVIVDAGTGTGFLAQKLAFLYPHSHFVLNDLSQNMLRAACQKMPATTPIRLMQGDMEKLVFPPCDLWVSSLALQWTQNPIVLIRKLYYRSRAILFSCLLPGTFEEWGRLFRHAPTHVYPDRKTLEKALTELLPARCSLETEKIVLNFERGSDFLVYLKKLGAATGSQRVPVSELRAVLKKLNKSRGGFSVSYHLLYAFLDRRI